MPQHGLSSDPSYMALARTAAEVAAGVPPTTRQYELAFRYDDEITVLDYLRLAPSIQSDMDATNAFITQSRPPQQFDLWPPLYYPETDSLGNTSGRVSHNPHRWLWRQEAGQRNDPMTLFAASRGWIEVIAWLFCGQERVNRIGATLAHMFPYTLRSACADQRLDIVEMLLQSPVCIELLTDEARQTALDMALHSASTDAMCQLLVAHGANVHLKEYVNTSRSARSCEPFIQSSVGGRMRSPLWSCDTDVITQRMREVVVVEHDALVTAVVTAHLKIVKMLLVRGFVDFDARADKGRTVLMTCVVVGAFPHDKEIRKRRRDVLRCLLDAGVDTTLRDQKGKTALHVAVANANLSVSCVEMLIDHTVATRGIEAVHGDATALALAFRRRGPYVKRSRRVVRALLERGACSNVYRELVKKVDLDIALVEVTRACDVCKDSDRHD